jgi:hypothetical protein
VDTERWEERRKAATIMEEPSDESRNLEEYMVGYHLWRLGMVKLLLAE